ncbi:MAG: NAD-dependent epimerase/dehydratase family protein [Helicobacteraceae bacterium]|jgi:NADH dehydrogenase|nr:NAD-dependent epimerase/dehydratase family protein [Helicobacteraceae bacterium]
MRILIVGGSGYVGGAVVDNFHNDHDFINMSRTRGNEFCVNNTLLDVAKPLGFLQFDKPIDMIINCMECHPDNYADNETMKREYLAGVRHLLEFAEKNGVKNFIHFSVNHIHAVENDYQQAKFVAEGLVKKSGVKYIIFKPTIIFGKNSPFDCLIESMMKKSILLKFWREDAKIAPVHILDVIANIKHALKNDKCWNETYVLRGPDVISFGHLIAGRNVIGTPMALAMRSAMGLSSKRPRHLRLVLDWVNVDDSRNRFPQLLAAETRYRIRSEQ